MSDTSSLYNANEKNTHVHVCTYKQQSPVHNIHLRDTLCTSKKHSVHFFMEFATIKREVKECLDVDY